MLVGVVLTAGKSHPLAVLVEELYVFVLVGRWCRAFDHILAEQLDC